MTGDDLKRAQDGFLKTSKKILLEDGRLRPVGFVITLHKHVDKLFESGWGLEFIDPKACVRDAGDDTIATLILDLAMDYKRLYHAILNVFPKTRDVLPQVLKLGEMVKVDDPYKHVMRPFLQHMQMDEKDVVAATMRHVCDKIDAFACVMQSEAWMRAVSPTENVDQIYKDSPEGLGQDKKSIEVVASSMETYDFARMLIVPIRRAPSKVSKKRDGGKILGFGDQTEAIDSPDNNNVLQGRLMRFLKPLPEAS